MCYAVYASSKAKWFITKFYHLFVFLNVFCVWYMHVYMNLFVSVYPWRMCISISVQARGPQASGVFLNHFLLYIFRKGLSLNLEFAEQSNLESESSGLVCLCPSLQCWLHVCTTTPGFLWGFRSSCMHGKHFSEVTSPVFIFSASIRFLRGSINHYASESWGQVLGRCTRLVFQANSHSSISGQSTLTF